MAQISCKNLCLGYDGKELVHHLNFEVDRGDYLCIVGENGVGKTTLMRTLLGLRPPMDGTIEYEDGLKGQGIGYLPQQTDVQRDFPASVWEIVLSGCQRREGFHPFYRAGEKALALQNIRRLHLEPLKNRCYRELSGGQQQRVLLARALCATQQILLLDEPASGLDPAVTKEFYGLIKELNQSSGITVIMITHDIAAALQYAGKILHLGKDVFFGTRDAYLESRQGFVKGGEA
ncbi:MAG: ABC transporter ATP-binding protein [Lachnospiraceae bacterium]|nr:ABC transporter ATP-binding protein [Lachnospiraceae bacterium]